jgi:hypothetical protein
LTKEGFQTCPSRWRLEMTAGLEALVVAAYVFADEYPVPARSGRPRRLRCGAGRARRLPAAMGVSSDRQFLGLIGRVLRAGFRTLPRRRSTTGGCAHSSSSSPVCSSAWPAGSIAARCDSPTGRRWSAPAIRAARRGVTASRRSHSRLTRSSLVGPAVRPYHPGIFLAFTGVECCGGAKFLRCRV